MGFMPASIVITWKRRTDAARRSSPTPGPHRLAPVDRLAHALRAAGAAPARRARQVRLGAAERAPGPAGPSAPHRPPGLGAWRQRGRKPVRPAPDREIAGTGQ